DNVTIFGESAGGQSISVLHASPATRGLFKRAIAQSGTPEFGSPVADHEHFATDLLNKLGIKPGDREAITRLSAQDTVDAMPIARKLLAKGSDDRYGELMTHGNIGCVYGDNFMPLSILDSLQQGNGHDVDLIIGTVLEDGRLFPLVMPGPESFSSWLCIKLFKGIIKPKNEPELVFKRYKHIMPGASNKVIRGQILTDSMFRRGTVKAAEAHTGTTYLYQFNWSSPVLHGAIGAIHGIDVPFTNGNLEAFAPLLGDLELVRELADTVSEAWVNFAKHGIPSSSNMPTWTPFDNKQRATMVFDSSIELQYDIDSEMRNIWDG
ncbi:MAG: carboxylesterase/lipase family protein, partial [Xanthomonadales bacterium]|nr:carboxylesterase/lipase family protein [Xanthomonadales bacterium]